MISNDEFTICKVAYFEGWQYKLISIFQLVLRTSLKVSFDEEASEIVHKESNKSGSKI